MSKKKQIKDQIDEEINQEVQTEENTTIEEPQQEVPQEDKSEELLRKVADIQDKYLRLSAEFDNFRKRTTKEKMDLCKIAGEDILKGLLPIMDDFDRAKAAMADSNEVEAIKEGVELIFRKLTEFLASKGVKEIDAMDQPFDTDLHESIAIIPSPDEQHKGKVIDVTQKGYTLYDKVIRFAKVVIGQ